MYGMTIKVDPEAVLLLIDIQQAFAAPVWGERNNPDAEANIGVLVSAWSATGRPIVRVRHASTEPGSPLRPEAPGHAYQPVVAGLTPDLEIVKSVNSAFLGTPDLGEWLIARGFQQLVITGIQTNMCCETTARFAGNLGYDALFVIDATHTFDRTGPDGATLTADQLTAATATNLHGEFARVVHTADLVDLTAAHGT
jgi:nicotinamidase-related amidase